MDASQNAEITRFLKEWNDGNEQAKELLLPFVYEELKRQARYLMNGERVNHTLQPTALVHEAFLKLSRQTGVDWKNRQHFYGIACRLMREILIDHARRYAAGKRGGRLIHFSIDEVEIPVEDRAASIIALNDALEKLAELDSQQAQIVEMRFFGGLTNEEISAALGISERTVRRDWQSAKLWLVRELRHN